MADVVLILLDFGLNIPSTTKINPFITRKVFHDVFVIKFGVLRVFNIVINLIRGVVMS